MPYTLNIIQLQLMNFIVPWRWSVICNIYTLLWAQKHYFLHSLLSKCYLSNFITLIWIKWNTKSTMFPWFAKYLQNNTVHMLWYGYMHNYGIFIQWKKGSCFDPFKGSVFLAVHAPKALYRLNQWDKIINTFLSLIGQGSLVTYHLIIWCQV